MGLARLIGCYRSKNAVDEYLKPALAKAKDPDGNDVDDFAKVDVVAHSQGGLIVRAYIQSEGYDNDIRRFAMVGTPNEGSANTYYMVQGGDPQKADAIGGKCTTNTNYGNPYCFYSRATDELYKEMNEGESPFKSLDEEESSTSNYSKVISNEVLVDFYRNHVHSGNQLSATFELLSINGDPLSELDNMPNDFLIKLNGDVAASKKDRMTTFSEACNNPQKVILGSLPQKT